MIARMLGSATVLRGGNIYDASGVIVQRVALGSLVTATTAQFGSDFPDRFIARFATLRSWQPGPPLGESFLQGLSTAAGMPFVETLLQATLAVEASARFTMYYMEPVTFSCVDKLLKGKNASLVWSCVAPSVSRMVVPVALTGLLELMPDDLSGFDASAAGGFESAFAALQSQARRNELGYNVGILVQAAVRRGIPWEKIRGPNLRFGHGSRQRIFRTTATENTSFVAQSLARDKRMTNRVLADVGIPVPVQARPKTTEAATVAAERIGYPVVVKPLDGRMGHGVSVGVSDRVELEVAFERALKLGSGVVVESVIAGSDHRLLVVDGCLVAATKRVPPSITGDGKRSIGELVNALNEARDGFTLVRVEHDAELDRLLGKAGYTLGTVLPAGVQFTLRSIANYHAGGITIDVTDEVHPENRDVAVRAARAIGLDVAGIDFITDDIGRSYRETGGAIIEINARPGLDLHFRPAHGKQRDVGGAVVESVISRGDEARIPIGLVTPGGESATAVLHILQGILRAAGRTAALLAGDNAVIDDVALIHDDPRPASLLASLFRDPRIDALIRTISFRSVVRRGLLHDACDAVALLSPIGREKDAPMGLRVVLRANRGALVVAARESSALNNLPGIDPPQMVLLAIDPGERVRRHLQAGGIAIMTRRGGGGRRLIELVCGDRTLISVPLGSVPGLVENRSRTNIRAHLFAIAMAYSMGLSAEEVARALMH